MKRVGAGVRHAATWAWAIVGGGLLSALGRRAVLCLVAALWWAAAAPAAASIAVEEDDGRDVVVEIRGMWVVRDALGSPGSIDHVLWMADTLGINTLFVQVNGRAEAYYRSDLVPPAPGLPEGFDPLQYVLEGAKARGIEVHAWVNAFTAGMLIHRPASPDHVLHRHPDWVLYHRSNRSLLEFGPEVADLGVPAIMLDPGVPEVRDYVVAVVEDIVLRYPVDGIHLDYLRYPSTDFGYHPRARALFEELVGVDPLWLNDEHVDVLREGWGDHVVAQVEEAWREWRRRQVTDVLRRVYHMVNETAPWVKVSVAVHPGAERAKRLVLQDWAAWLQEGIVDAVVPMVYTAEGDAVGSHLRQAALLAGDRHVYGGLGVYRLGNRPDALRGVVAQARAAGVQGIVLFSYNYLRQDAAMVDLLRGELLTGEARLPGMPWKPTAKTEAQARRATPYEVSP